ncbi:MAG: hypothetical protein PHC53_04980, partial [Patescibacteria group bacterium]|nr:hypothetical protein [Patescibacteria group bacterium]
VMDPWLIMREWHEYDQLKRAIWHVEVPIEHGELIEVAHGLNLEVGLAINPKTPIKEIFPFINPTNIRISNLRSAESRISRYELRDTSFVDEVLVMGVIPGKSGQKFMPTTLKTIRALRRKFPKLNIGEDGGLSLKNAHGIIKAGANRLNAAGAIFLANDPSVAYHELQRLPRSVALRSQ